MSKQTEALKLALEALETAWTYDEDNADGYYFEAITALREALAEQPAQQEPEPPSDENIFDAWVSASESDGIAYDGQSFERGYRLGRGEYDEYTGALVADALATKQFEVNLILTNALVAVCQQTYDGWVKGIAEKALAQYEAATTQEEQK